MAVAVNLPADSTLRVESQGVVVPWLARPSRLADWWEMRPFPVTDFLQLVRRLSVPAGNTEDVNAYLTDEDKKEMFGGVEALRKQCEECMLPLSAAQLVRIQQTLDGKFCRFVDVEGLLPELMNRIEDESKRHVVMAIEPDYVKYIDNPQFFDSTDPKANKVSVQFPSTAEDIAEAGKCLACARGTACVMHLQRVMEAGLAALAKAVGVGPQNDWGKYLDGIDRELERRMKASGARTPDEQFYAEARVTFDGVRRAWRNPTMHVDKTYTTERAEEILLAARSFMRHLATRISE